MSKWLRHVFAASLALSSLWAAAGPAAPDSVSRLAMGPDDTLFLADWKSARVLAVKLPAAAAAEARPFNVNDLDLRLAKAFNSREVQVEDMVVRTGTGQAVLALTLGAKKRPALALVDADGKIRPVDLKHPIAALELQNAPDAQAHFWRTVPARSFTVTDMKWHQGELFVAGLSNQSFASTLRRIKYPFEQGQASVSTTEIYHTTHNQLETRAPIRAMSIVTLKGKAYLAAAYTCTPLVLFALEDLKPGAHVSGKVVAELGYGNTPAGMLSYTGPGADMKTPTQYLMVAQFQRGTDLIPQASLEEALDRPGLDHPVAPGQTAGSVGQQLPLAGVMRVDNLDDHLLLAVRRQLETNRLQLVSINKQLPFRLSDFVSEYLFPDYRYDDWSRQYMLPGQNFYKEQEGFPELEVH